MKRVTSVLSCAAALSLLALAQPAYAATITYDTVLASPSGNAADEGFYNGTGNPQGGFKVVVDNGVEIGLRAKHRQDFDVIHTSTDVYQVPGGPQGGGVTNRAWWNFEFSIDLQPGGPNGGGSGLFLYDIFPASTLTVSDVTAGVSNTVAFPYWFDSATWGASGEEPFATVAPGPVITVNDDNWGFQNSQNPVFGDFPLNTLPGYSFDMYAAHLYRFTLDVRSNAGLLLASNTIDVNVVPEPASMLLLGSGIGLAALAIRRRRKTIA